MLKWFEGSPPDGILKDVVYVSYGQDEERILSKPMYKGEIWYFTITPNDGNSTGTTRQSGSTSTIGNAPPRVQQVGIQPSAPTTEEDLSADYNYSDPEDDLEGDSEIWWYKNELPQPLFNNLRTVSADDTTKGDVWRFSIRPRDADGASGDLSESSGVTIVNRMPEVEIVSVSGSMDENGYFSGNITIEYNLIDEDQDFCRLSVRYRGGSAGVIKKPAYVTEATEERNVITNVAPGTGLTLTWESAEDQPAGKADNYVIFIKANDNTEKIIWQVSVSDSIIKKPVFAGDLIDAALKKMLAELTDTLKRK